MLFLHYTQKFDPNELRRMVERQMNSNYNNDY